MHLLPALNIFSHLNIVQLCFLCFYRSLRAFLCFTLCLWKKFLEKLLQQQAIFKERKRFFLLRPSYPSLITLSESCPLQMVSSIPTPFYTFFCTPIPLRFQKRYQLWNKTDILIKQKKCFKRKTWIFEGQEGVFHCCQYTLLVLVPFWNQSLRECSSAPRCHVSHVMFHMSRVKCLMSDFNIFFF